MTIQIYTHIVVVVVVVVVVMFINTTHMFCERHSVIRAAVTEIQLILTFTSKLALISTNHQQISILFLVSISPELIHMEKQQL